MIVRKQSFFVSIAKDVTMVSQVSQDLGTALFGFSKPKVLKSFYVTASVATGFSVNLVLLDVLGNELAANPIQSADFVAVSQRIGSISGTHLGLFIGVLVGGIRVDDFVSSVAGMMTVTITLEFEDEGVEIL